MRLIFVIFAIAASLGAVEARAATIGVYFDAGGQQDELEVGAFANFNFYVVITGVSGGLSGYEFGLDHSDAISVTGHVLFPENAVNLGTGEDFIVGLGGVCSAPSGSAMVVQFSAVLLREGTNFRIRLTDPQHASFPNEGPAYASCDDNLGLFDEVKSAYLNPSADSMGRLKERYDN